MFKIRHIPSGIILEAENKDDYYIYCPITNSTLIIGVNGKIYELLAWADSNGSGGWEAELSENHELIIETH